MDFKEFEVVSIVRLLSQRKYCALSRLASRVSAFRKFGAGAGEDPCAQVKEFDHGPDYPLAQKYCKAKFRIWVINFKIILPNGSRF